MPTAGCDVLAQKRFEVDVKQRRGFNRLEKRIISQMFPCGMCGIHTIERFPDSIGILGPSMETLGNALALFKGRLDIVATRPARA